ncbi:MAG: TRZ/ATZ family protein [Clostridiaceae bacterium]|nr:TRZ/ATZ family protein [Clostridiaceae bacterium]
MERRHIDLPLGDLAARSLKAGDLLALSGPLFTARDAAHKRLTEALEQGLPLPVALQGQTIYYAGPCPAPPGQVIGSVGPTTSGRMDAYTPLLLQHGLRIMIGKGQRSPAVIAAMRLHGAVYLGATGGAGALLSQHVRSAEVVAYPDLGPEAIRRLVVVDFPVIVLIDSQGNSLYQSGPARYRLEG